MTTHILKIEQAFASAILNGTKKFEVRYNDRGYQAGDLIKFRVVDNGVPCIFHLLNEIPYRITYVLNGYGIKEGYCVFAIEEVGA